MKETNKKTNYRVYARKSSEAEDRQVLSIASQIAEDLKIAASHGVILTEADVLQESRSAKDPYTRSIFEQLIKEIEDGKVQGIVAWHANRLSRNSIDAARLIHLMDQGKLHAIITQQQVFRNTPQDKFMFMLFCSQAKLENDNKGVDVKRGLRKRREQGFLPGMAKIGYLNDFGKKGSCTTLEDKERFPLVKQVFELYISGKYSVRGLLIYINNELGLRTVQRQKEGGMPIQLSHLYRMLRDPYYAGFFYAADEDDNLIRYEVNPSVPRAITETEFWQIQARLGRKGVPRPSKNKEVFAYINSANKCEKCYGSIVAEEKHQLICSKCKYKFSYPNRTTCPKCEIAIEKMKSPTYLEYVYYHCVNFTKESCKERSIREDNLDDHFADYIQEHLEISPDLREWCIRNIGELDKKDAEKRQDVQEAWRSELSKKEAEETRLVEMRVRGLVEDDRFISLQSPLQAEIKTIREKLGGNVEKPAQSLSRPFELACGLSEVFRNGEYAEKKSALSETVSNLTIKDKKASIYFKDEFSILMDGLKNAKVVNPAFEPRNYVADKDETEVFTSVRPTLLELWDDFGTINWPAIYPAPEFTSKQIRELLADEPARQSTVA